MNCSFQARPKFSNQGQRRKKARGEREKPAEKGKSLRRKGKARRERGKKETETEHTNFIYRKRAKSYNYPIIQLFYFQM